MQYKLLIAIFEGVREKIMSVKNNWFDFIIDRLGPQNNQFFMCFEDKLYIL